MAVMRFGELVILDVFGTYYFAPSFVDLDCYVMDIEPGQETIQVVPHFTWPEVGGSASGIFWYAAMINAELTGPLGQVASFEFGWGN